MIYFGQAGQGHMNILLLRAYAWLDELLQKIVIIIL